MKKKKRKPGPVPRGIVRTIRVNLDKQSAAALKEYCRLCGTSVTNAVQNFIIRGAQARK